MIDILYFPIWWYSIGLKKGAAGFINSLKSLSQYLGLKVLIKNFFKPMFGQYDFKGRVISFLMRLVQLFVYLIILFIFNVVLFILLALWIILPIVAVWQIIILI